MLGKYSVQSYVTPYPNDLLELVNNELSPYVEVFTKSDLDIMTVNSNGSVSSSTGHVEDGPATNTTAYWKSLWTPKEPEQPADTGETTDPNTGMVTDPNTGTVTDPNTGTVTDPNAGTVTDPNTGTVTDPNTGTVTDPNTGTVTDPNTGTATDPNTGTATDPNTGDGGFVIIAPPPTA